MKKLTWLQAIEMVLEKYKTGLHCKEIAKYAKELMPTSNTSNPYKNVNGILNKDCQKCNSKFSKIGKSYFILKDKRLLKPFYGIHWKKNEISKKSAKLIGYIPNKQKNETDFSKYQGIYILYDINEKIVRVGQSDELLTRIKLHTKNKCANEWETFSWFGFPKNTENKVVSAEYIISFLESILLKCNNPRLNKQDEYNFDGEYYNQKITP